MTDQSNRCNDCGDGPPNAVLALCEGGCSGAVCGYCVNPCQGCEGVLCNHCYMASGLCAECEKETPDD